MNLGGRPVTDPFEKIIEEALLLANIDYFSEDPINTLNLDFYIPSLGLYIEVKTMHTERIYKQMDRVYSCIMVQGKDACEWLAKLILLWGEVIDVTKTNCM